MKNINIKLLISLSAIALASTSLQAAFITGEINFAGNLGVNGITTSGGLVTAIDFADNGVTSPSVSFIDEAVTGDFDGLEGDYVSIVDPWDLTAVTPYTLWSVGGFSFELTSISSNDGTEPFLGVEGLGVIKKAGFDDTEGTFSITAQNGEAFVSFSATSAPVPEPSTYAMFGTAFAILGFVGYRKHRNA